jgi:CBS domain-containing protein
MHPGVLSCPPETSLEMAARTMASHHIHALVVSGIERVHGGERLFWRLLSDVDLLEAVRLTPWVDAGSVAATEIVSVEPSEPLERAADLMHEHRLSHLLVVDGGVPVGMISTLDIAGVIAWGES